METWTQMKWRRWSAVPPHGSVLSQSNISGNNHSLNFSNMVAFHHGPLHFQIKFTAAPVLVVCLSLSCLACPLKKIHFKVSIKVKSHFYLQITISKIWLIPIMIKDFIFHLQECIFLLENWIESNRKQTNCPYHVLWHTELDFQHKYYFSTRKIYLHLPIS